MEGRDEIRSKLFGPDAKTPDEVVEMEGFPPIHLRRLNLDQLHDAREAALTADGNFSGRLYNLAMLIMSAHDGAGMPIFDKLDREALLHQADGQVMQELLARCIQHNKLSRQAQDDMAKAFRMIGAAAHSSDSVSASGASPERSESDPSID